MFSGKIYTADKNFTRPPVAAAATNFKSARKPTGCWRNGRLLLRNISEREFEIEAE